MNSLSLFIYVCVFHGSNKHIAYMKLMYTILNNLAEWCAKFS